MIGIWLLCSDEDQRILFHHLHEDSFKAKGRLVDENRTSFNSEQETEGHGSRSIGKAALLTLLLQ